MLYQRSLKAALLGRPAVNTIRGEGWSSLTNVMSVWAPQ